MVGALIERTAEIFSAMAGNPMVFLPLIGSWIVTSIYFIINNDESHGHSYVMSTGIAHIFTAYMVSPLATSAVTWDFKDIKLLIVLALFVFGLILTILSLIKALPDFLVEFFGDPGHALAPSLMAILYINNDIPFDWTTFSVIIAPILVVFGIKLIRRSKTV
ncbi:MAG: hypothetical protein V1659_01230 [Candidatus Woesearchaeota archaeon]